MFKSENIDVLWHSLGTTSPNADDIAVAFASAGYYECYQDKAGCSRSVQSGTSLNQLLNNAPASFEGALIRFRNQGTYHYMCSRNNNFTNRSQKGQITVR